MLNQELKINRSLLKLKVQLLELKKKIADNLTTMGVDGVDQSMTLMELIAKVPTIHYARETRTLSMFASWDIFTQLKISSSQLKTKLYAAYESLKFNLEAMGVETITPLDNFDILADKILEIKHVPKYDIYPDALNSIGMGQVMELFINKSSHQWTIEKSGDFFDVNILSGDGKTPVVVNLQTYNNTTVDRLTGQITIKFTDSREGSDKIIPVTQDSGIQTFNLTDFIVDSTEFKANGNSSLGKKFISPEANLNEFWNGIMTNTTHLTMLDELNVIIPLPVDGFSVNGGGLFAENRGIIIGTERSVIIKAEYDGIITGQSITVKQKENKIEKYTDATINIISGTTPVPAKGEDINFNISFSNLYSSGGKDAVKEFIPTNSLYIKREGNATLIPYIDGANRGILKCPNKGSELSTPTIGEISASYSDDSFTISAIKEITQLQNIVEMLSSVEVRGENSGIEEPIINYNAGGSEAYYDVRFKRNYSSEYISDYIYWNNINPNFSLTTTLVGSSFYQLTGNTANRLKVNSRGSIEGAETSGIITVTVKDSGKEGVGTITIKQAQNNIVDVINSRLSGGTSSKRDFPANGGDNWFDVSCDTVYSSGTIGSVIATINTTSTSLGNSYMDPSYKNHLIVASKGTTVSSITRGNLTVNYSYRSFTKQFNTAITQAANAMTGIADAQVVNYRANVDQPVYTDIEVGAGQDWMWYQRLEYNRVFTSGAKDFRFPLNGECTSKSTTITGASWRNLNSGIFWGIDIPSKGGVASLRTNIGTVTLQNYDNGFVASATRTYYQSENKVIDLTDQSFYITNSAWVNINKYDCPARGGWYAFIGVQFNRLFSSGYKAYTVNWQSQGNASVTSMGVPRMTYSSDGFSFNSKGTEWSERTEGVLKMNFTSDGITEECAETFYQELNHSWDEYSPVEEGNLEWPWQNGDCNGVYSVIYFTDVRNYGLRYTSGSYKYIRTDSWKSGRVSRSILVEGRCGYTPVPQTYITFYNSGFSYIGQWEVEYEIDGTGTRYSGGSGMASGYSDGRIDANTGSSLKIHKFTYNTMTGMILTGVCRPSITTLYEGENIINVDGQ